MIQQDKYLHALRALNTILTRARWMAHEANASELANLLDAAEILPNYIAQPEDATEQFRVTLNDISREYPSCSHLIEEFDQRRKP